MNRKEFGRKRSWPIEGIILVSWPKFKLSTSRIQIYANQSGVPIFPLPIFVSSFPLLAYSSALEVGACQPTRQLIPENSNLLVINVFVQVHGYSDWPHVHGN
jgi:hypothetical protein